MDILHDPVKPEMIFSEHIVRHHECAPDGGMKLRPVFDLLQDAAAEHADLLEIGMNTLLEKNVLWVLSRLKIRIRRRLLLGETLTLKTYPSGVADNLFATRQFTVFDKNGEMVVKAASMWLIIDAKSFRPKKILDILPVGLPENETLPRHYPKLEKLALPAPDSMEAFLQTYSVRHSGIDLNRHLNNAIYADFVYDVLGGAVSSHPDVAEIQINFMHSGALDDSIECRCFLGEDGRKFHVSGLSPDGKKTYFQAGGRLRAEKSSPVNS